MSPERRYSLGVQGLRVVVLRFRVLRVKFRDSGFKGCSYEVFMRFRVLGLGLDMRFRVFWVSSKVYLAV